jgi:kinesin family protein 5
LIVIVDNNRDVLKGYNGTIFAYGQTGSGKTHTMFGPGAVGMAADGASGADLRGIIPRAVREIYERTAEMAHECQFTIRVSFLEVYQERIYDLLIPASPALPIRENKDRGIHVPGLTEEVTHSAFILLLLFIILTD